MAVLTPGGTTQFNLQDWAATAAGATHQKEVFNPTIYRYPGKIFGQGNQRKWERADLTEFGSGNLSTNDGSNLTSVSTMIGTPATITPVHRYIKTAWSEAEQAQIDIALRSGLPDEMEKCMAEGHDAAGLVNVASLTHVTTNAQVDAGIWRRVVSALMGYTNGEAMPGDSEKILGVFSHTAYSFLQNIEEFTHADVRGDSEDPLVKGIYTRGGGVNVRYSTVVYNDGSAWWNVVYVKEAFMIGWNLETHLTEDMNDLQRKLLLSSNMGVAVLNNNRAVAVKTTDDGSVL